MLSLLGPRSLAPAARARAPTPRPLLPGRMLSVSARAQGPASQARPRTSRPARAFLRASAGAGTGAAAVLLASSWSVPARRLSTGAARSESQAPLLFATSHAVFRKPPYEEIEAAAEAERQAKAGEPVTPREVERPKIGFGPETKIGQWKEALLGPEEDAGEDAISVTPMAARGGDAQARDLCLAVADGVGGWTEEGVDPALFSQALMYYLTRQASDVPVAERAPKQLLADAYQAVLKEPAVSLGSSTACVITLDAAKGLLRSANLGDSGYVVLRDGAAASEDADAARGAARGTKKGQLPDNILYIAPPLQYSFNAPYQLSKLTGMAPDALQNKPRDAAENEIALKPGDIIVAATDGLWDNVHIAELVEIARLVRDQPEKISKQRGEPIPPAPASFKGSPMLEQQHLIATLLARTLVHFAVICMGSPNKATPFMVEAARNGINYPGGKIDDCSVVTAVVVDPSAHQTKA